MTNAATAKSLWHFACGHYRHTRVKDVCLQLQNNHRGDVLIVLWLCWLHATATRLDKTALAQACAIQHPWQQPLQQLRALRTTPPDNIFSQTQHSRIREQVLATELAIEQNLLQQLETATKGFARNTQEPLQLTHYLETLRPVIEGKGKEEMLDALKQRVHY